MNFDKARHMHHGKGSCVFLLIYWFLCASVSLCEEIAIDEDDQQHKCFADVRAIRARVEGESAGNEVAGVSAAADSIRPGTNPVLPRRADLPGETFASRRGAQRVAASWD